MLRNPSFCFFYSFSVVSLTCFINKPDSSRDLTVFIVSSFSLFEMIIFVVPDPKICLRIPASAADAAAVNPNGIKTFLAHCVNTGFIKGEPFFSSGMRSLSRNPPDCSIL